MAKTTSHLGIETKAEFARRLCVNKSTVTRYAQAGRLVLAKNGKVMVNESLEKINATQGHRTDLKEKHASYRGQSINIPQGENKGATEHQTKEDEDLNTSEKTVGADRAAYKSAKLQFENNMLKLEESLRVGKRLDREEHNRIMSRFGYEVKNGMERLIDNLTPMLCRMKSKIAMQSMITEKLTELTESINT